RNAKTLCRPNEHKPVHLSGGKWYQLRNPYWKGTGRACIHSLGGTRFKVLRTPRPGGNVTTYPDILRGCIWNICTPNSNIPIRVSRIRHATTSWRIRTSHAPGTWNAAYDIWFGKHRMIQGHADGAELMIFLTTHNCCGLNGPQRVNIGHHAFLLQHWRPYDPDFHVSWNYIQFRFLQPRTSVHGLNLKRIIEVCVRKGLIRPSWWMENVEAGFEIWSGGRGLTTAAYRVNVR
ncbi:MAG TPA: hypothetical protein VFH38_03580, partial [Jatrophihabitans sp.]|nr:hypothetical protein [Jatrophihabitans sp.]